MVYHPAGQVEQSVADRGATGEPSLRRSGVMVYPPVQVVGQDRAGHPRRIGEEPPRWTVNQSGVVFDIPHGQLHAGVIAVHPVGLHGGKKTVVGEEGVMSPIRPQLRLFLVDQAMMRRASINHSLGHYSDRGIVHTNTMEGFWSLLKRAWYGTHHHYQRKFMPLYVTEQTWQYNHRRGPNPFGSFISAMVGP